MPAAVASLAPLRNTITCNNGKQRNDPLHGVERLHILHRFSPDSRTARGRSMIRPIRNRMYLILAGCIAFILFFTVFGDKGLLRIFELRQDMARLRTGLNDTRAANEKLKREIIALKSDYRYVESIARKDFGLVRANEVIYQFPPEPKP